MHKRVILIFIFYNILANGMLQTFKEPYCSYKPNAHTLQNKAVYSHPFLNFSQAEKELVTLTKKFGFRPHIKKLLENFLSLNNLSLTNKFFYTILSTQIKEMASLSHISCNSIFQYFYNYYDNILIFNFSCGPKNCFLFSFYLMRDCKISEKVQIYDQKTYNDINHLCNNIIHTIDDTEIKDVCAILQKECVSFNLSSKNICLLKTLLSTDKKSSPLTQNKLHSLKELEIIEKNMQPICPTNLEIRFIKTDNTMQVPLESSKNFINFFLKSILMSEDESTYLRKYTSFLETFYSNTTTFNDDKLFFFTTKCGFSNEPTIPISLLCNKHFYTTNKSSL